MGLLDDTADAINRAYSAADFQQVRINVVFARQDVRYYGEMLDYDLVIGYDPYTSARELWRAASLLYDLVAMADLEQTWLEVEWRRHGMHECPIEGCTKTVADDKLMCFAHWKLILPKLGRELYEAWDNGRGKGTEEHAAAMRRCIGYVNTAVAAHKAEDDRRNPKLF